MKTRFLSAILAASITVSVMPVLANVVIAQEQFGISDARELASASFSGWLNQKIPQPVEGTNVNYPLSVSAVDNYGNDITDMVSVDWSIFGVENDDGYITFTADGTNANLNVKSGVSNYFGYVKAVVSYLDKSCMITTPFAIIGNDEVSANQIIPEAGYPVNMNEYADSLLGYEATATGLATKDLVLNNWSIYGSNGSRTLALAEENGRKALKFASNDGVGSTVGIYQWQPQDAQVVVDFTAKVSDGTKFGCYSNTGSAINSNVEWEFGISADTLTAGRETISGIRTGEWYRFIASVDRSIGTYTVSVYDNAGNFVGKTAEVEIRDVNAKYFWISGGFPVYLSEFKAYMPSVSAIEINSDAETVAVPDSGSVTVDLSAELADEQGIAITGAVDWSLAEEYANVSLEATDAQTATLTVKEGASGAVTVVAARDGKLAQKTIQLTTSSDVLAFKSIVSSIAIPFDGAAVADFTAETRDSSGAVIDGGNITYTLLAEDGVTEAALKGVSLADGKLTVTAQASPGIIYVKAADEAGLSAKTRVNIHGFNFDFGSDEPDAGYTQVANTQYTDTLGYGFEDATGITVNPDNVSSENEFRFKAKVPNGNYVVEVETTSPSITSETVDGVSAKTGIAKTGGKFNVAVCDGVLDLAFAKGSAVSKLEISRAVSKTEPDKPRIYVIGDSTANSTATGTMSWANCVEKQTLPECFSAFYNKAMPGKDSVSYYNQGLLEEILLDICPGDYVTVNMGITSRETDEEAAFYTLIRDYYMQGILQRGGIPVILTATPSGFSYKQYPYDETTGKFTVSRGDSARNAELRQIASELNLGIIEVGQHFEDYFNLLTAEDVAAYNAANGTEFTSVLELVKSWYADHNHYTQPLGDMIGEYILSELTFMETGEIPSTPTPLPTEPPSEGYVVNDIVIEEIITVAIEDNSDNAGVLAVALYDEGGRLVGVEFEDLAADKEYQHLEFNMDAGSAKSISAFIWESIESMKPISEVFNKNL